MSRRITNLKPLLAEQAEAAQPQVHAALSASAGTGKTHVLTARVLRLLLHGAAPDSILCLTFTKAAAAEMANRVNMRLAAWVRMKDSDLGSDLAALGEDHGEDSRRQARRLFARVLDCPGGLRIQTIHSFAQALLAAFPAEAGLAPGFQPIEGRAEQELVRRTLADLLAEAETAGDERLLSDVQSLSRRLGEAAAIEYLQVCARHGEALRRLGPADSFAAAVGKLLGLPEEPIDAFLAEQCVDERFDCDLLRAIAAANRAWDTKTGRGIVDSVEHWLGLAPAERAASLPDLAMVVFTGGGEMRKVQSGQIKADPEYEHHAQRLAQSIGALVQIQRSAALAGDMAAGLRAGHAFAEAYAEAKKAAGVADFNDLIEWTRGLLSQPGMGDWVRYKLDRQVDHVLVDEAQDTNAAQWEIIDHLVGEFFAGSSEGEARHRTLFMVGDVKQSIYGFQGTEPQRFEQARRRYREAAEELVAAEAALDEDVRLAREFRDLSIAASFRSAQPVLDLVDAMIAEVGHGALALGEAPPPHRAFNARRPGQVELWHPFEVEDALDESDEGEERWVSLRDRRYAETLAARVRAMLDEAPMMPSTGKPLVAGDILVLVRSRGELASLIVSRLFAAGVPVAGVDRLHLHEPLAVQDLLAAVRFVVQPDDDLSLACLLVSPLFGWDQEQLRHLAKQRQRVPLWRVLRERRAGDPACAAAHEALAELLRIADFMPPSRFLETILSGPLKGRRRLYSRLGLAGRDAIDELMNSAIEFERTETASLDGFLAWFSRGTVDVQRDPGQAGNEVRVMTVHGAKGLEAPLVLLADATGDPSRLGRTPLSVTLDIGGVGKTPLLRPRKDERASPLAEVIDTEETRNLEEHLRLLYVGLTRAADRLIVSGVMPKAKKDGSDPRPPQCWHRIVEQAFGRVAAEVGEGHVALRYGESFAARPAPAGPPAEAGELASLPEWATTAAPIEARPPRPLAPSAAAGDDGASPPPSPALVEAARRGTLLHRLFERLPELEPGERRGAALRWLAGAAPAIDDPGRVEIAEAACAVIANPDFAEVFGPDALAEAPIVATLGDGRVVAGTVDRLLVRDEKVLVVDFKTGAKVPADCSAIPTGHRAQMQAYADALRVVFPGRPVASALLYIAGPRLIVLGS